MAELIHDIAPGAGLSFHSTFNSRIDFADGIDELRLCGADVLVDDTIYLNEPMFQDGPIAQALDPAARCRSALRRFQEAAKKLMWTAR